MSQKIYETNSADDQSNSLPTSAGSKPPSKPMWQELSQVEADNFKKKRNPEFKSQLEQILKG